MSEPGARFWPEGVPALAAQLWPPRSCIGLVLVLRSIYQWRLISWAGKAKATAAEDGWFYHKGGEWLRVPWVLYTVDPAIASA